MSHGTCCRLFHGDLNMCHVCGRMVQKNLTQDQLNDRAAVSGDLIDMVVCGLDILNRIITGDEMWCYLYDP